MSRVKTKGEDKKGKTTKIIILSDLSKFEFKIKNTRRVFTKKSNH